eukprot:TRINITY_DN6656_c0_g1_i8.p1 TRINITY_DN6656_c0_g1~~TRINITY_DN6656_c0_g1_i8.p1  ORF type:complete len:253 (-),score=84.52 TRINITY_DN6656_c0_g1_i8:142-900(-)
MSKELTKTKDLCAAKQYQLNSVLSDLVEARKLLEKLQKSQPRDKTTLTENNQAGQTILGDPVQNGQEGDNDKDDLEKGSAKWQLVVMDESGAEFNKLSFSEEDKEREMKLRQFYDDKSNQLNLRLVSSDTRSLEMSKRQETLEKLIITIKGDREDAITKLDLVKQAEKRISEELETTKKNYEQQLSVLSEHVLQMTHKLSMLKEELEVIKAFKVRCGKCQVWNSIEWLITNGKNGRFCSRGAHASSLNYAEK